GRRGFEAIVALGVLAVAAAIVAGAMMVIEGAKGAMARAERDDRPDIVQVKSRFNRAVFETPRSGNLAPLTLPVYEPLIDRDKLNAVGGTVVGILDRLELRDPPPRTIDAPALNPDSSYVSSGVFVTLRTSEEIFGRSTLTNALVVAPAARDVPSVVEGLREAFRLEPAVFI